MVQTQTTVQSSVSNIDFHVEEKSIAGKYVFFGYIFILLFFCSIVAWAAYLPLSSAAIAPGLLGKEGNRKVVQHLEGGIIRRIFVKEGDKVELNQKLVELENIQSGADFNLLGKQRLIAQVKERGLVAESKNQAELTLGLPENMTLDVTDKAVGDAIQGQIDNFYVRRKLHNDQLQMIDQRSLQEEEILGSLYKQRLALIVKGDIILKELNEYEELKEKGLATRAQVFSLKRDVASNDSEKTTNQFSLETTRQEINNLKLEKLELEVANTKRIVADLDTVRDQLVSMEEKLTKTKDKLERSVIHAPIQGAIVNLRVNTIGGVIKPGEPVMDIVPDAGKLIIEAQIDPKDRDTVTVGQDAEIRFTAFNQRLTEPVRGKVVLISADRLVEAGTDGIQLAYYKAKVELLQDPSEVMNGAPVFSGMQAEVMIITGERSFLEYFLNPIRKSFHQAFRDD